MVMAQATTGSQNFFVRHAGAPADQARKRLRLGAPFDRRDLLDHSAPPRGSRALEMLVEAFQHGRTATNSVMMPISAQPISVSTNPQSRARRASV